jgi:hypothetical protein
VEPAEEFLVLGEPYVLTICLSPLTATLLMSVSEEFSRALPYLGGPQPA